MNDKELIELKNRIEAALSSTEIAIKEALKYTNYADTAIEELPVGEIQLETTVVQRNFENLVQSRRLQLLLLEKIDDVIASADDNKKRHRTAKALEELVHFVRLLKHESEQSIANEQAMIQSTNELLSALDLMRNGLNR